MLKNLDHVIFLLFSTFTMERSRCFSLEILRRLILLSMNISICCEVFYLSLFIFSFSILSRKLIFCRSNLGFKMIDVTINILNFSFHSVNFFSEISNIDGGIVNVIDITFQSLIFILKSFNNFSCFPVFIS